MFGTSNRTLLSKVIQFSPPQIMLLSIQPFSNVHLHWHIMIDHNLLMFIVDDKFLVDQQKFALCGKPIADIFGCSLVSS